MTIYVESAFLQNFIVDYFLLYLSLKTFKLKVSRIRIILSSFLGSIAAIFSPLISGILSVLFKIVLGFLMILIIYSGKNKKTYLLLLFCFLGFTFLFGGVCYAINCFVSSVKNTITNVNLPTFAILIVALILFYVEYIIINKIYSRKTITKFEYSVTLFSANKQIEVVGFLDSGNLLKDNNKPVILIDAITFLKLYPKENLSDVLLKKINKLNLKNAHLLNVKNINQTYSNLVVFTLPKIILNKTNVFTNISCAISLKKFNVGEGASCLLNPFLFEGYLWKLNFRLLLKTSWKN